MVQAKRPKLEACIAVEGTLAFPIDMLRLASCVPQREEDSNAIGVWNTPRTIYLRTMAGGARLAAEQTARLWAAYGWKVVAAGTFLQCKKQVEQRSFSCF